MSKLISFVGYSRVNNVLKLRTATDEKRVFQLEKLGDTDVNMVALPLEMTKSSAAKWALTAFFAKCNEEVFALFAANAKDENPFAKKAGTVSVKKTAKVAKKSLAKQAPVATVEREFESEEAARADLEANRFAWINKALALS